MFWAAVPEAAVDKDGQLTNWEYDVNSYSKFGQINPIILSESETAAVKRRPERSLRSRIAAAIRAH
jgi:hypothetical protein